MDTLKEIEELATKTSMQTVMSCLKALAQSRVHLDSIPSLPLEMAIMETVSTTIVSNKDPDENHRTKLTDHTGSSHQIISTTEHSNQAVPVAHETRLPKTNVPISEHVKKSDFGSMSPDGAVNPDEMIGAAVPLETWNLVVQQLRRQKGKRFFLGALLKDCKAPYIENGAMVLPFNYRSNKERMEEELQELSSRQVIESALEQFLGSPYELRLTLRDGGASGGMSASATSPLVRSARAMGGRVIEEKRIDE